jgi:hypothetical protein
VPSISVIIPTRIRDVLTGETLRSLLNQVISSEICLQNHNHSIKMRLKFMDVPRLLKNQRAIFPFAWA